MVEFASRIVICLALACALGFIVAWLLRSAALRELRERIEQLETELGVRLSELERTRREAEAQGVRLGGAESALSAARQNAMTLQGTLERQTLGAQAEAKRLTEQAANQRASSQADLDKLRARVSELEAALAARVCEFEAQQQLGALNTELANAEEHARGQGAQLQTRLGDAEAAAAVQRTQLQARLDAVTQERHTEVTRLRAEIAPLLLLPAAIAAKEGELKSLAQARNNEAQTRSTELQTLRDALAEARSAQQSALNAAQQKDDQLRQLREQLAPLVKLPGVVAARLAELADREAALAQGGAELQRRELRWGERADEFGRRVAALEADLQRCRTERALLGDDLQKLRTAQAEAAQLPARQYTQRPSGSNDDLKWIFGVGPVLEKMLHKLGVYEFRQIALWSAADVEFFDKQLEKFHGRIQRENWVRSAVEEHYKKHGEWLASGKASITLPETNRS